MNEQHLLPKELKRLKENALSFDEKMKLMEHIASCDECSEKYAACFEESELIEIDYAVFEPKPAPKRTSTTFYNLKVAIVTAAAVAMVLFMPLEFNTPDIAKVKPFDLFEKYDEMFTVFSNKINTYEVKK